MKNKLSIKAIVLGNLTDILGTNLVMLPVMVYIGISYGVNSLQKENLVTILVTPGMHLITLILGGAMSILGGYVAARTAKFKEYLHGALSASLCVLSGLYGVFSGDGASLAAHFLYILASPTLGVIGAYLYLKTKK